MTDHTWTVILTVPAKRDLNRVPEKVFPAMLEALPLLEDNPQRVGKPLKGEWAGTWSLRRGEYRVLYQLDERRRRVYVVAVAHRHDIYRSGR